MTRWWAIVVVVLIVVARAIEAVVGRSHVGFNQTGGSVLKVRAVVKSRPVIVIPWAVLGVVVDGHEATVVKIGFIVKRLFVQEATLGMTKEAIILGCKGLCCAN